MTTIYITPHDPLIVRDGRPFGLGGNIHCLEWPYPSLTAGTLRTAIGKKIADTNVSNPFDDDTFLKRIKDIRFLGPILTSKQQYFFPAPSDILLCKQDGVEQTVQLKPIPLKEGEGCNLPNAKVLWPIGIKDERKPEKTPTFWSRKKMVEWLKEASPIHFQLPNDQKVTDGFITKASQKRADKPHPDQKVTDGFITPFQKEYRTNVKIEASTYRSEDSMLFTTESLAMPIETSIAVRVESNDPEIRKAIFSLQELHPFGGERRLAELATTQDSDGWDCPEEMKEPLKRAKYIRMVLVTPAIFTHGWLPGWLDKETLTGKPPESSVELQLRGACVERWKPISGWSLEKGQRGPKPIRRLVPAGSVYFFEIVSGSSEEIVKLWLRSISDTEKNDGFGLAVWGVWNPESK